jgi:hypothetical protein
MDGWFPTVQFSRTFFAPTLNCYLYCRILPTEKVVPFLLTQAHGTSAWAWLFSPLSEYGYPASFELHYGYSSAFLLACQHIQEPEFPGYLAFAARPAVPTRLRAQSTIMALGVCGRT